MDTALWPQVSNGGVVVKQMEGGSSSSSSASASSSTSRGLLERKARPQKDQALNCPRCNSTNTKFCYYNNYSLSQPRYFCKACRRYWTEGGSLRNVPVGGGSRKNKRPPISSSSNSSDKKINVSDHHLAATAQSFPHQTSASQNPKIHHAQDLNLAIFPPTDPQNPNNSSSAMELLKSGMVSRGLTAFLSMPPPPPPPPPPVSHSTTSTGLYNSNGFGLHEFKPSLNFSLEGFESGYGGLHEGGQETAATSNGQLMFPMEDLKQQVSNTNGTADQFEQNRGGQGGDSSGYWNGMLGGGSW